MEMLPNLNLHYTKTYGSYSHKYLLGHLFKNKSTHFTDIFRTKLRIWLNTQFGLTNVGKTRVFILEMAHKILQAICSEIKQVFYRHFWDKTVYLAQYQTSFVPKMLVEHMFLFLNKWYIRCSGPFVEK